MSAQPCDDLDHAAEPTDAELLAERPRCRADCAAVPRPCPWIGCRHNTYLTVTRKGRLHFTRDRRISPLDVPARSSCVLDLIDAAPGGLTLEDVGAVFGLTRERIRQIEVVALDALHQIPELGEHHGRDLDAERLRVFADRAAAAAGRRLLGTAYRGGRPGPQSSGEKRRAAESRAAVYAEAERTGRCQFPGCTNPPRPRKHQKSRAPAYCAEHADQNARGRALRRLAKEERG